MVSIWHRVNAQAPAVSKIKETRRERRACLRRAIALWLGMCSV
jgi:hypothetical protein